MDKIVIPEKNEQSAAEEMANDLKILRKLRQKEKELD